MPKFGDIIPNFSGRSHIGVDGGPNRDSFDASSISPFGHIIGISGIYVDPVAGQSGVVRYNRNLARFELSYDGGRTFGVHLGGQDGRIDLNNNLSITVGTNRVEQTTANQSVFTGNNYDLTASGNLNITALTNGSIDLGNVAEIEANILQIFATTSLDIFTSTNAPINIATGNENADINVNAGAQLALSAFSGSGNLQYRMGPYQAWYWKPTYDSSGGPFGDGYWPIMHSGQTISSISQQAAYDGGPEIEQDLQSNTSQGLLAKLNQGVLKLDDVLAGDNPNSQVPSNYGFGVQSPSAADPGISFNPGSYLSDTFPESKLSSNFLYIRGSGTFAGDPATTVEPAYLWVGISGSPSQSIFRTVKIRTNYSMDIDAPSEMDIRGNNTTLSADNSLILSANGTVKTVSRESITNTSTQQSISNIAAQQLSLSAFSTSGKMQYQFGPNEAWHVSPSHTSSFFPLPHSGQVEEMIRKDITPFSSGVHTLGGNDKPYQSINQLSGVFYSTIHGNAGKLRFNPANSGMEVLNNDDDGWHPFGQSITRDIAHFSSFHDLPYLDPGDGTIARTNPLVVASADITTIAVQLFLKGYLCRLPVQFTVPDWVDTNYPIKAKASLFLGNTAPSGAGQNIEIETNIGWNGDNSSFFAGTPSKATAQQKDISTYGLLDYVEMDLGDVVDARSYYNRDLVHGMIKRDARPSNFLDDDYPDAVGLSDIRFIGRVKRGYSGEFE